MKEYPADARCVNILPACRPGKKRERFRLGRRDTVPRSAAEDTLVKTLERWRSRSGQRFLILVGFPISSELRAMASLFPRALQFVDGWADVCDLAQKFRSPQNPDDPRMPQSLKRLLGSLGVRNRQPGSSRRTAGNDADEH